MVLMAGDVAEAHKVWQLPKLLEAGLGYGRTVGQEQRT